jgi:hypothetical protein
VGVKQWRGVRVACDSIGLEIPHLHKHLLMLYGSIYETMRKTHLKFWATWTGFFAMTP